MADDEANQALRTSNLARIRENQRRSRARRKEYLQELEAKFRTCEQLGVEASAEIQAAARKVVEENRRLRLLLIQKGISEAEIDDGLFFGPNDNVETSTAAAALEIMLTTRKECRPSSNSCGGGSADDASQRQTQGQMLPSTVQQTSNSSRGPSKSEILPAPLQRNMSGYSSSSSASQTPTSAILPRRFTAPPAADAPPHQSTATAFDAHFDHQDGNFPWSQLYEDPSMLHDNTGMNTNPEFSSCYAAADAIRTIKPDLGYELEMELGCTDDKDCGVPNNQIFSLMDRYSKN